MMAAMAMSGEEVVGYRQFGAKGDGVTNDIEALVAAHNYANEHGLPVKADDDCTYYIGATEKQVVIMTDTDFGKAKFIIDDSNLLPKDNTKNVFVVASDKKYFYPKLTGPITTAQKNVGRTFDGPVMITLYNEKAKRFIRYGVNANSGSMQVDSILVDAEGNIDPSTPLAWDFEEITKQQAIPLDVKPITIQGGIFTTIANRAPSNYTYYSRGFNVSRSNATLRGIQHYVEQEGENGAPYHGFFSVTDCANVTLQDIIVTGHKYYWTIGNVGKKSPMGTYDLSASRAINLSFVRVTQSNDISDTKLWGVMGTNFCKNLMYDHCRLSRFDAHQGVYNATIRDCELGYCGMSIIGYGTFLLENTTTSGRALIYLRDDYGSFWRGDIIIRNCKYTPSYRLAPVLIGGQNNEEHDFGYTCVMPQNITIDGLYVDDSKSKYKEGISPYLFGNFNPAAKPGYQPKYPMEKTKTVTLKNITFASGRELKKSQNTFFVEGTIIK